jgi:hypothetical protein
MVKNRVARFFLIQYTQKEIKYRMDIKYKHQTAIKFNNIFQSKALQNIPKLEFFVSK